MKHKGNGVIDPAKIYTVDAIGGESSFGPNGIRKAAKNNPPLKILYLHGRAFVRGSDFLEYFNAHASAKHHKQGNDNFAGGGE